MTTPMTIEADEQKLPQQDGGGESQERTPDSPQRESWKDMKARLGLSDDDEKNLLSIKKQYLQQWSPILRANKRKTLKRLEYFKGNQYISFDPYNFKYFDPFDAGAMGTQQGRDDDNLYKYIHNICQWLARVFIATLSPSIPKTRFWPGNADRQQDLRTAEMGSKANAVIERQNNTRSLLKQELFNLFTSGCYFAYTRWVRDGDRAGTHQEPVYGFEKRPISDDRYVCSKCGAETPADAMVMMAQPMCQQCGAPLGEGDYYPAEEAEVPVVQEMEDVPNGQVITSIFNNLHVDVAPHSNEAGKDPLISTPILNLEVEADIASLRRSYPEMWDELGKGGTGNESKSGDNEMARSARMKVVGVDGVRANATASKFPTYSRCWYRDWSYDILDKRQEADKLREAFPKGCLVVTVGDTILEVREEKLTDKWTWGGTIKGLGAYPPAVVDPAMDFQDRINDTGNTTQEYVDRLGGGGPILVNADLIDYKAIAGMPAGNSLIPIKPKAGRIENIQNAMFQPAFKTDANIYGYAERLVQAAQLLTGIVPQSFGGHQDGIDTFGGQKQALDTATGLLGLYWDNIREEHANRGRLAVKCLAENATEDLLDVIQSNSDAYKNQVIHIDDLQGEAHAYPEADQGFPESYAERRDRLEKMILEGVQNPIIMEMFEPMKNRREAMMHLAPPGMELPGQAQYDKVMSDIDMLVNGVPVPIPDPLTGMEILVPSVHPDRDFDEMELTMKFVKDWAAENYYMKDENPDAFENVRLYYKEAAQMKKEMEIAASLNPDGSPAAPPEDASTTPAQGGPVQ
jgi:hypothetical protein